MRDLLLNKGCKVYYNEFNGGHDYLYWRGSFGDALISLIGKKDIKSNGE